MIGTSGPSTSMVALSTPMPRSAASTCSAVDTSGPSRSPRTVANSVEITDSDDARTSRSQPSGPVRTKIKPASTGAGPRVKLTGKPECTPTPVTVACDRSVVCRLNFIPNRPLPTYFKDWNDPFASHAPIRLKYPQVTADNSQRLKARQLTLFYQLLPQLCRIRAKGYPNYAAVGSCFGNPIPPRNT